MESDKLQAILVPKFINVLDIENVRPNNNRLMMSIWNAQMQSDLVKEVNDKRESNELPDEYDFHNGLLYKDNRLFVPPGDCQLEVLTMKHDGLVAGHFGIRKTLELLKRELWWPRMSQYVKNYVATCDICNRPKLSARHPHGLLQPLPIPDNECITERESNKRDISMQSLGRETNLEAT